MKNNKNICIIPLDKNFFNLLEEKLSSNKEINETIKVPFYNNEFKYIIRQIEYEKAKETVYSKVVKKLTNYLKEPEDKIIKYLKHRLPMDWGVYTLLYIKEVLEHKRVLKNYKIEQKLRLDSIAKEKGYFVISNGKKEKILIPYRFLVIRNNGDIKIKRLKEIKL